MVAERTLSPGLGPAVPKSPGLRSIVQAVSEIEFRRRRTEDVLEPFYVRISAAGDVRSLAFSENSDDLERLDGYISVMRGGAVETDRLHDAGNDVWFFRFRDRDSGGLLFRSMPCPDEEAMESDIALILGQVAEAPLIDDTGD